MREMDVEFVRFKTEVDVVNLDQYFRVGLMSFFCFVRKQINQKQVFQFKQNP